ncbi:MAG: hypothetical protein GYB66_01560, partial [Chloroflexi bacterium]|nr:hypothetical protein [Chloroflexota bacterium]
METEFTGILTGILAFPIFGAIVILLLDKEAKVQARWIALSAVATSLALGLLVYFTYDVDAAQAAHAPLVEGELAATEAVPIEFQFVDQIAWIDEIGISYQLGVDGLTAAMVMLTGLASVAGVLISWSIEERTREFMAFFLLLVAGVYGVFLSTDVFLLLF